MDQIEERIRHAEIYGALITDPKIAKLRGIIAPGDGPVLGSDRHAIDIVVASMFLHEAARR